MPSWWDEACSALAAADPCLAALIARYPGAVLSSRAAPFQTLLRAIVGQQVSVLAADAVWARLQNLLPQLTPAAVLGAGEPALRATGLSQRKVEYVRDLARHFADGRIDAERLLGLDDEAVIRELVAVRGIGRWSAQMFLIFNLNRPDVWPVDDIGLQRAFALQCLAGARATPAMLAALGEPWRPWRTVACWYLWRSLDPVEVRY